MTLSSSVTESRVRFWQAHVRALAASGLSRRGYCRRHELSYHALTYWVRKFRQVPERSLKGGKEKRFRKKVPSERGTANEDQRKAYDQKRHTRLRCNAKEARARGSAAGL